MANPVYANGKVVDDGDPADDPDDAHAFWQGRTVVSVNQTEADGSRQNQDLLRISGERVGRFVVPAPGGGPRHATGAATVNPDSVLIPSGSVLINTPDGLSVGRAVDELVRELAPLRLPAWQSLFRLARRLKTFPEFDPMTDLEPVRRFCRGVGIDPEAGVVEFPDRWDLVRLPEGSDPFDACVELARKCPTPVAGVPPGTHWATAASIAFQLHLHNLNQPFPFALTRLAPALGTDHMTASRVFKRLVTLGVIEVTKATWSYSKHESREVRFIGQVLPEGSA